MAYAPPISPKRNVGTSSGAGKARLSAPSGPSPVATSPIRQRGIYSEFMGTSSPSSRKEATSGPSSFARNHGTIATNAPVTPSIAVPDTPDHASSNVAARVMPPRILPFTAAKVQAVPPARSFRRASPPPTASSLPSGEEKESKMDEKLITTNAPIVPVTAVAVSGTVAIGKPVTEKKRASRLEPKVIVPFEQRPGKPPRRIEIERKKRLYASQNIEDLLRKEGVDYSRYSVEQDHDSGKPSYLPLEIFDDTEYEGRRPTEWIQLGSDPDVPIGTPGSCAIEARALRIEVDDHARFVPCEVTAWDDDARKFVVRWRTGGGPETDGRWKDTAPDARVFPVHVCFQADNPFVFAKRVANAHAARREFEANIRYALYVDSMPTDEIAPLDTEQVNRILQLALNTKKLKQNALDTTSLLNEVNIDYARTMNKIIFDVNLKDPAQAPLRQSLKLATIGGDGSASQRESPYLGVVPVPFHDFPKHFSDFCFHSFYTKLEAINALVKVNGECLKLQKSNIFHTNITKSVRLEEFENHQNSSMTALLNFLKDKWTTNLKNCIINSLREVGKGWLNLQERNREVYQYSKLKKFMMMVNFMMEDALRFLVEDSTKKYSHFLHAATKYGVVIRDTHEVSVAQRTDVAVDEDLVSGDGDKEEKTTETKGGNSSSSGVNDSKGASPAAVGSSDEHAHRARDFALFTVEMVLKEDKIQYTTSPSAFLESPLNLFDKALAMLHDIPQLETFVMEHLFTKTGNEAKLASVRKTEKWVKRLYRDIKLRLRAALAPMDEYLSKFAKYRELIALQVDQYVAQFAQQEHDLKDVRKLILQHTKEKAKIEKEIPKTVWLGIVLVNCDDVRKKLSMKHRDIIQKLLDFFTSETKAKCDEVNKVFKKMETELKKQPDDIAMLMQMREMMTQVPVAVAAQRPAIKDIMQSFDLLDDFAFRLPKEIFRLKWDIYGWPKKVHDQMISKDAELNLLRGTFLSEMRQQQEVYEKEKADAEKKVSGFGSHSDIDKMDRFYAKAVEIHNSLEELQAKSRHFNNNENLFGLRSTDYSEVTRIAKNFEPFYMLWTTAHDWLHNRKKWMEDSFMDLNGDDIATKVATYHKNLIKATKAKGIKTNPGCLAIGQTIKKEVEAFRPHLPLIIALLNPGMRARHWELLSQKLPFEFKPDEALTLNKVVDDMKMGQYLDVISKVGDSAAKEYQIESALNKMEEAWKGQEFEVNEHKSGTYVIKVRDEALQLLDEHLVTTQAMQFSPYRKPFQDRITRWYQKLNTVSEVIEECLAVQRQWLGLQAIFSSPDIQKQLPAEAKRFAAVNKSWRLTMQRVHANPDVLSFCDDPGLLSKLTENNKQLQLVQKRLSDYLDKKRGLFARFYFLSDGELLQILSQTQDPTAVQPHLKKCFENIARLQFERDLTITAMYSSEPAERMPFIKPVDPKRKNVEYWLGDVEQAMKDSVREQLRLAVKNYQQVPRTDWVRQWAGQAVLNGSQIHFTWEVEQALRKGGAAGIAQYHQLLVQQIAGLVGLVRGELTDVQRIVMGALIVLDVHARDVVDRLKREQVSDPSDFAWICQLRYYQEEQGLVVEMVKSTFPYSYEYLGNTDRLVITPLTDRCYLTLMTALQLHLGGSPSGPAGTGKTETVKDLAKAVAKKCVVFNCSEGLDHHQMGKFFKGLATSGSWVCFDEFNRIDVEVLSVVAQQIMTVWTAVREQLEVFVFEESSIRLDRTCSVFITMNPGYAGRTELPDNLKSLFRPVAMMVPDYAMIAQILLYSLGFNSAESLSRKVVATFRLASEQLSVQDHYDYGMRAVKTVITRAGNLKREDSRMNEDVLLLRALRDVNVPKFLKQDLPLFEGIISDLFPKVEKPDIDYGTLMNSIIVTTKEQGLQPVDAFLEKCVQLFETTVVRHGLMLVGPTGGGKTTCIHTLRRSLTRLWQAGYDKVRDFTINPKSVTMGQLYGEIDTQTHEWSEGILSKIVRDCIDGATEQAGDDAAATAGDEKKAPAKKDAVPQTPVPGSMAARAANERKWIIFDGPVDALWIENMNSVLDDNKMLCLVNSEVLRLTPQMTMIFEVEDLAVASPATVSRCGMVYMEPTALGLQPMTRSWIDKLHPIFAPVRKPLAYYFDTLLEPAIAFVRKQCAEPVPSVDNNLARSCQQLLEAMMAPLIPIDGVPEKEGAAEALANFNAHIEPLFLLSLIWSVGATTDKTGRTRFSTFIRQTLGDFEMKEVPPDRGLVYDYSYDLKDKRWVSWMDTAPAFTVDPRLTFNEIIVPTMDSIRYTYLLDLLVKQQRHVLFTGNTGTGKSVNAGRFLASLPDNLIPVTLIFSAATSANQTEELLNRKLQKQRKNVYGPPVGKKFVVFVDDMNMPAREKYFAQPPIELLRQWMDHRGWYNRKTLTFNEVVDISFIGAMGPPGGGRNPVTPRFLRHFMQLAHTDLDTQSLILIFSTIVKATLAKFTPEVQNLQRELVHSTIDLFQTISLQLRPTPDKSHYTFNLRDLSAVFQGLLSASYRRLKTVPGLLRLWVHENRRVFYDRLIDDEDRQWLDGLLGAMMKKHFRNEWNDIMPPVSSGQILLFGDYMEGMGAEQRVYDEVKDMTMARKVMEDALVEYNEENTPMKLVMFTDAIEHVSRISRILRQPGGNALLLGVGGSGRQSLTRLAAFMVEYELFQIEITKHYGVNEWHEDLKRLLLDAGLKEQPTVFLFSDTQIVKEQFFEDVNNILNSGEVPNLYSNEDLDNIFATCKIDCQRKNIPATKINAYAQFINRVRAHLHVVLCMSPVGKAFRTRLRMFPAIVNCCTIDWFSDWPNDALRSVAQTALNEAEVKLEKADAVVQMFGAIHQSVSDRSKEYREELRRYNYVTPTSYLELINVFNFLLQEKRGEIDGMKNKLQLGLSTLHSAASEVAGLQQQLNDSQPRLEETAREVEKLMEQMVVDKKEATERQEIVEKQAAEAAAKAADCKAIADEAQLELDKALPDLDRAVESLKELNKRHIEEVRDFKKPPSGVVLTMEAACIMLRHKLKFRIVQKQDVNSNKKVPLYWETAQRYLLRHPRTLLDSLKKYERDSIPEKVIKKIKPYVSREDFSVKKIEIASKACRAICMWVHAMYNYYHINENVKPKRARLATAQAELDRMNAGMEETKKALQAGLDRLEFLQQKHQKLLLERERLEMEVRNCTIKLKRANRLLEGLGGEQERWSTTIASLSDGYESIVGDVLVSSGTIAYLGAFTAAYRTRMTSDWRAKLKELGLPHTDGCSIRTTLADPVQIRAWCLAGLPTDSVSTENGIIMSKARRWPLMIDPQGQASKFIKKLGSEKFEQGMAIAMLSDPRFLQTTEIAIKNGQWLLLENLGEELDPALEPLLQQQIVSIRGHPHIRLGENVIEYDDKFHLYMTTKLSNPHYAPELQVKVTLLNFTTTPEGLQDQMLGIVVSAEAFSLEQEKNQRVIDNAKLKNKLQELEDHILKLISENKGHNILEQEELIETLASSKITSSDVARELASAEVTEQRIDEQRRAYAPVAQRASILYFCISDLGVIDPMYQYSLTWFVHLFEHAIKTAPASTEQKVRLPNLIDHFTKLLYENVCRSLFEAHKMLFSFLLTVKIEQGADRIRGTEWRYLVAGAPPVKKTVNPSPDWLTDNVWNGILALSELDTFTDFEQAFITHLKHFRSVWDSNEPHKQPLPEPWDTKLDSFQKLLVLKCLRPDKMSSALADYVTRRLGREFVDFPQFNLAQSFRDSTATTPLIFILSRGADPASKLMQFAQEMNFRDKLVPISLGQGQGEVAERQVADAMRRGTWVLLQNCHLAVSWLPQLERLCDEMKPENVHEDFRLWLTSMPTKKFPVSILQNGIKMTNEPPKGLRQNLMRSYLGFTDGQMTKCKKPQVFKKMLFALCFFHAVVLDRRKFGPLGWNIMYDFSENDLSVSVTQLREFLDMYEASAEVPYKVIHFLTYDIHYGGRVTDDLDRRTICTILDDFINPNVLSDDYKFSASGRYISIPTGTREYYLKYISSMEAFPDPEVFGMHDNADITSAQEETATMFGTILGILPRASDDKTKKRETLIGESAAAILKRTPRTWEIENVTKQYPTTYSESMNTVLVQEAIRYNRLLTLMRTSLRDLMRALRGEMVMTEALEQMADSLFNNQVPDLWNTVAYPSLMPLAQWVSDLNARVSFINKWVENGIPTVFWISGFFFPQAFLTGTLQNYARRETKPIDTISFGFRVLDRRPDTITERPRDGIYVHGLHLQGARWDPLRQSLVESRPKELFTQFPVIWFVPEEDRKIPDTGVYKCPVYKTLTRAGVLSTTGHSTNFVTTIEIPSSDAQSRWVKAGVALFCALRY